MYTKALSTLSNIPQIFDNYTVNAIVQGKMHLLNLSDTVGEVKAESKEATYTKADVIIFTFNKSEADSYENLKTKLFPEVKNYCPKVPSILISVQEDEHSPEEKGFISYQKLVELARELNVVNYYETTIEDDEKIKKIFTDAANSAVDPNLIISLEGKLEFSVLSSKNLGRGNPYCKFGFADQNGHFLLDKMHKTKKGSPKWKPKDKNSKEFIIQEPTEAKKFKIEVWDSEVMSSQLLGTAFMFFREFQDVNEMTTEIKLKPKQLQSTNSPMKLKVNWKFTPKNKV